MNNYQRCWWEQARSDHKILIMLRDQDAEPCHQLHYLQMVTEKLSKAYFWRDGSAPKKSHVGLGKFMRKLLGNETSERQQRIAELFSFGRVEDFQNWARSASPLAYEIERLAPDLAGDGPNPEYPWPHNAPQFVPATHDFDVWRQLKYTAHGHRLLQIIKVAVEKFPVYG